MSDLHKALHLEQNGLCAISGVPLNDGFHLQNLSPLTQPSLFQENQEQVIGISPEVNTKIGKELDELTVMLSLPGMRDNGTVRLVGSCFLSEYESRFNRLDEIKDDLWHIDELVGSRYVLYDYKGNIMSNSLQVLNYLNNKYGGDITIGGDYLTISSNPLTLIRVDKLSFIKHAKSLWKNITSKNNKSITEDETPSEITNTDGITIRTKEKTEPALGVNEIASVLATISTELTKDSGMMIGIFGRWGRGKTFLANQTTSKLIHNNDNWYRLNFSAWKYQNTESSWSYLHDSILETLEQNSFKKEQRTGIETSRKHNIKEKFKGAIASISKIADNLTNRCRANIYKKGRLSLYFNITIIITLFIWVFYIDKFSLLREAVGLLTAGAIILLIKSLIFFNSTTSIFNKIKQSYFTQKTYKNNLGLQAEIEESIEAMLATWIPDNSESKLVMFIDDIDRCDIENVLDVIDGLRLILDNPEIYKRVIIISAIDERMLRNAIDTKYNSFEEYQRNEIYSEYLQKIFIIGLKLDNLCENESLEIIDKLLPKVGESASTLGNNKSGHDSNNAEELVEIIPTEEISEQGSNNSKNELDSSTTTEIEPEGKECAEISLPERKQLLASMIKLKIRTPRSIKIFYYKYLISKKLLFISLKDKDLITKWEKSKHEAQLIEHLISISNGVDVDEKYKNKNTDVEDVIQKVATLVSAI